MEQAVADGERAKERVFRLAGFASEALERTSRSGKKFGKLLLQDFSGNMEIMFFGEDYLRFSNYLKPGLTVFIQGLLQSRPFRPEQIEFRVQQIQLLEDLKRKQTREIEIRSAAHSLTDKQVRFLTENILSHPGNCELHLQFTDVEEKWKIDLRSVSKKVEMNDELAYFLQNQDNMNIRINIFNN